MYYSIFDCFMIAFVVGFIFGLVYEFFRIIRNIFGNKVITFLCDVVFFILAAFLVFNLSLFIGDHIRIYTLLGFGAGIFSYIQTVGRIVYLFERFISRLWKATFGRIINAISKTIRKNIRTFAHIISVKFRTINDFYNNKKKSSSSLLKFNDKKMYNIKRDIIIGERSEYKNVIQASVKRSS